MTSTYSLLNGAELLKLLTERILIGVPSKAARECMLARFEADIGEGSQRCKGELTQ